MGEFYQYHVNVVALEEITQDFLMSLTLYFFKLAVL